MYFEQCAAVVQSLGMMFMKSLVCFSVSFELEEKLPLAWVLYIKDNLSSKSFNINK